MKFQVAGSLLRQPQRDRCGNLLARFPPTHTHTHVLHVAADKQLSGFQVDWMNYLYKTTQRQSPQTTKLSGYYQHHVNTNHRSAMWRPLPSTPGRPLTIS